MITLQDCMDCGFTFEKIDDPVFKRQTGFDFMICYLQLSKSFQIDYDVYNGFCQVMSIDEQGNILKRKQIKSREELEFFIEFLASKKVRRKLNL
jgi:hypothetical protein